MSSLVSIVHDHGIIKRGDGSFEHHDAAVIAAQMAINAAGYRIGLNGVFDGVFGDGTDKAVRRFQAQHGLTVDGKIGTETAEWLDRPSAELIETATPITVTPPGSSTPFPHDDTASLIAFYGKPWEDDSLLTNVPVPFPLTYDEGGGRVLTFTKVRFHKKVADQLHAAYAAVWDAYGRDIAALDATRFPKFSGSYNYRPIRGSSRLSCHAFGAAVDHDAEDLPLGKPNPSGGMPAPIVEAFKAQGFFWGNEYAGRKDPMHFQAAHE